MDHCNKKIILDLCAGTGSWSKPYQERPDIYDVRLVTLPEQDVRLYIPPPNVRGILAAPPCTVFANSGARWKRTETQMLEGLSCVDACLRIVMVSKPEWWALENPVGTLKKYLGSPTWMFHPYEYGDPYTKKTLLWGRFNPPMKTVTYPKIKDYVRNVTRKNRSAIRAITPPGFARAFFEANP